MFLRCLPLCVCSHCDGGAWRWRSRISVEKVRFGCVLWSLMLVLCLHCAPKMSLLCLAITLTHMNRFYWFFAQVLLKKYAITTYFIFPHHLTNASALPGETGNPEMVSFHLNTCLFFTKNTFLKYHLVTAELPLTVKMIDRKEHSILQYVTLIHLLSVTLSEMGVVLFKHRSESRCWMTCVV